MKVLIGTVLLGKNLLGIVCLVKVLLAQKLCEKYPWEKHSWERSEKLYLILSLNFWVKGNMLISRGEYSYEIYKIIL